MVLFQVVLALTAQLQSKQGWFADVHVLPSRMLYRGSMQHEGFAAHSWCGSDATFLASRANPLTAADAASTGSCW